MQSGFGRQKTIDRIWGGHSQALADQSCDYKELARLLAILNRREKYVVKAAGYRLLGWERIAGFSWPVLAVGGPNDAALWHVRVGEQPELRFSNKFRAWHQLPANRQAYDQVRQAWRFLEELENAPEMLLLRQEALSRSGLATGSATPVPKKRRGSLQIFAAAIVILSGSIAIGWFFANSG